jgi:hypothetical protein
METPDNGIFASEDSTIDPNESPTTNNENHGTQKQAVVEAAVQTLKCRRQHLTWSNARSPVPKTENRHADVTLRSVRCYRYLVGSHAGFREQRRSLRLVATGRLDGTLKTRHGNWSETRAPIPEVPRNGALESRRAPRLTKARSRVLTSLLAMRFQLLLAVTK